MSEKEEIDMLANAWVLNTNGDALVAVRDFLHQIWDRAGLDGMLLPIYQTGTLQATPDLIEQPLGLSAADPFVPVMPMNTSRLVAHVLRKRPEARYAAVLRSCEARALYYVASSSGLSLENWLIISVDCLASFSVEDYEWRVQRAGSAEELSREVLRFARQGGIAPYRFRNACQMCASPIAQDADISLGLLGLPVREKVLVFTRNAKLAEWLHIEEIAGTTAPDDLVELRQRWASRLSKRNVGTLDRMLDSLPTNLPWTPREFIDHIASCEPCRDCLEVCPIYTGELENHPEGMAAGDDHALIWLAACVKCGMCEQACPCTMPLTAIHAHISRELMVLSEEQCL